MNIAKTTEGTIQSGHRGIRQWQQGGSNCIQMPDGQLCPVLLSSPAIVLLLTLMERGVVQKCMMGMGEVQFRNKKNMSGIICRVLYKMAE